MKHYIADTHFWHANMLKFEPENRPFDTVEEMNDALIERWNAKVKPEDEIYVLGDFCFDASGIKANDLLKKLNGRKFLVKGNHDAFLRSNNFDRSLFEWVKEYAEVKDTVDGKDVSVILFHYPIAVWNRKHHGAYHLFGHIHSNKMFGSSHPLDADLGDRAFNVGADVRGLTPVTLEELIASGKRGY